MPPGCAYAKVSHLPIRRATGSRPERSIPRSRSESDVLALLYHDHLCAIARGIARVVSATNRAPDGCGARFPLIRADSCPMWTATDLSDRQRDRGVWSVPHDHVDVAVEVRIS